MNPGLESRGRSAGSDEWETPRPVFEALHRLFQFTVDAAASDANARLPRYWTRETDGLSQSWLDERVFCNPPYSEIGRWTMKAAESGADVAVLLLPVRTGVPWFHNFVIKARAEVWFLRGRIKFELGGEARGSPFFDSMLAVYWKKDRHSGTAIMKSIDLKEMVKCT